MDIHRYEKVWFGVALLLIFGLVATVAYGAVGVGVEMVADDGGQVDPESLNEHPKFGDPGVERAGDGTYDAYVVARRFAFNPGSNDPIQVPADSEVTFHVTSPDVVHGFQIVGTNVNVMVIPGQVATVTVEFDEPGTYGVVCNEYCGSAHHTMAGQIEVVPPSEYEGSGGDSG